MFDLIGWFFLLCVVTYALAWGAAYLISPKLTYKYWVDGEGVPHLHIKSKDHE